MRERPGWIESVSIFCCMVRLFQPAKNRSWSTGYFCRSKVIVNSSVSDFPYSLMSVHRKPTVCTSVALAEPAGPVVLESVIDVAAIGKAVTPRVNPSIVPMYLVRRPCTKIPYR